VRWDAVAVRGDDREVEVERRGRVGEEGARAAAEEAGGFEAVRERKGLCNASAVARLTERGATHVELRCDLAPVCDVVVDESGEEVAGEERRACLLQVRAEVAEGDVGDVRGSRGRRRRCRAAGDLRQSVRAIWRSSSKGDKEAAHRRASL
jgi:hypothetical protein